MHDTYLHQGSGLHRHAAQAAPRVVTMASHGDRQSELPLLSDLCMAWTVLGYSVVVLDATMAESDSFPGLQQLLDSSCHTGVADASHSIWPIFPAALGLGSLCRPTQELAFGSSPLQHLGHVFRDYEIILVYASAKNLALCLPDSGIEPLLAVSGKAMSILSAYQALKQLLIIGRLQPTIVAVMKESGQNGVASGDATRKSLQDCAMSFLGHHVAPLTVSRAPEDMNRLALRLLENAVSPGEKTPALMASIHQRISSDHSIARSH